MAETQTGTGTDHTGVVNAGALQDFVNRIEAKRDERRGINEDLKVIYREVKDAGMDPETVRQMVKERELEPDVRQAQYQIRDAYRRALGMLADTPLGEEAMRRAENIAATEASRDARRAGNGNPPVAEKPKPFAAQPITTPGETKRRVGRPRKVLFDREHPQGIA